MSSPRDPDRHFRLERLGDRDGLRPVHLGAAARVSSSQAGASSTRAAYEALIDAVFTAHGAAEWLFGLRQTMAAILAGKDAAPRNSVASEAIRKAGPRPGRA
jgi:hypothetical protein